VRERLKQRITRLTSNALRTFGKKREREGEKEGEREREREKERERERYRRYCVLVYLPRHVERQQTPFAPVLYVHVSAPC